jgi:hypothetical protein
MDYLGVVCYNVENMLHSSVLTYEKILKFLFSKSIHGHDLLT